MSDHPAKPVELAALLLANALATAVQFLMMRAWVFRTRRESHAQA